MNIRIYGDEVLNKRAEEITGIDDGIRELAEAMLEKTPESNGIGLAAPQVGISKRMFVVVLPEMKSDEGVVTQALKDVFINPVITSSEGKCKMEEGCLSVPGIWEIVERAEKITVEYINIEGKKVVRELEGMAARVVLHEYDHLDGVLFVSRLSKLKQDLLKKRLKRLKDMKREE